MKLKNISFLLVAVVILNLLTFPVLADYQENDEDIYAKAYEAVYALGISVADKGDFSSDMTRGEFCDMVARLVGISNYEIPVCYYTDVLRTHAYASAVYALSSIGVVSGTGEGVFSPDAPILANQAAAIIVKAFKYTEIMQNAIYPASYLAQADKLDLFDGVFSSGEEALSRGEAFTFIANAIDAPVPEIYGFENDNVNYYIDKTSSAIEVYHAIEKYEGVLDSNHLSTLSGSLPSSRGEDQITVNGKVYKIKNKAYKNYLGYNVEFYAKDDEILYLSPEDNKILEIAYEDAIDFEGSYISYFENDKEKRISISKDVDVIYNGVSYPDYKTSDFDFVNNNGRLILIDNNHDNKYDCISVEEYVTYVVNYVNEENKTLYFRNYIAQGDNADKSRGISFEKADVIEIVRPDGLEIPLSVVLTNEAASVFESKDGKYVKIIVSADKVHGTVSGVSKDKITILSEDGSEAEYELDCREENTVKSLVPGYSGIFILNYKGEIAGITDFLGEGYKYGYLVTLEKETGFGSTLKFKVLCADGKMRIFDIKGSVKIDGEKYNDMDKVFDKFTKTDTTNGKLYPAQQIIRYISSDDDTKINVIDTSALGGKEDEVNSLEIESYKSATYRPSQMYVQRKVQLDIQNLIVFVVPSIAAGSASEINNTKDSDYSVRYTLKGWWVSESITMDAVINDNDTGLSQCAAVYYEYYPEMKIGGSQLYAKTSSTLSMVDHISRRVNAEGEEVPVINLISDGDIVAKECAYDECAIKAMYENGAVVDGKSTSLSRGDVIRAYYDADGIIQYTECVYDASRTDNKRFVTGASKTTAQTCGIAYSKSGASMKMTTTVLSGAPEYDKTNPLNTFDVSKNSLITNIMPESNVKYFVCDFEEETVRKGNSFDIKDYVNNPSDASVLFIWESYTIPQVICIYN